MTDFFFRTEDIKPEDVYGYFVENPQDRQLIDALKNRNPTILVGSRGVGKSFLLRVAQKELTNKFATDRVFPVYLSFVRSSLLQSSDPEQFKHWMLAKISSAIVRSLQKAGLIAHLPKSAEQLAGSSVSDSGPTVIEAIVEKYENSWTNVGVPIDKNNIPSLDKIKESLEDLADELDIRRFCLLIDEAAHIFVPEQQRQFFTLFRDFRSHCITCNAAVYPGVTSFGDTFQPAHDATMLSIDRDVLAADYVNNMREIVEKQADAATLKNIASNGRNFAILAYAASGNPRLLLKTLAASPKVNSAQVNETVREFYRSDIWSEHSVLAAKYTGHKDVIDWGRSFIENQVLPDIKNKNDSYLAADKNTSAYLWIHRDAPASVKESLRVLSYTGILSEQASGIKASRGEIGTRYFLNLGCLFSLEAAPAATAYNVARGLTPKRMTEFGANHPAYKSLVDLLDNAPSQVGGYALSEQLAKSIAVLDISEWQRGKLEELNLNTIGDVLAATEEKLKEATYVGNARARRMRNAAVAAVLEYLSG
ncbi:ORC-CDC6 family AAA ATPase [Acidiphilium acidophilum]|uniref:Orc1-like AAA ATPase domain-containing protein n=1 Tax=Acidiphilium acidophilum TaxID=76588 RepID=A0AAW9DUA9_ACIAO|nr:hypothetical protein [Acidiphilium acidophilum]MDX5932575.1 hypothetical protein [Acidiphilium acidophilum]